MALERILLLVSLTVVGACKGGGVLEDIGSGPEKDARFVSDLFTWQCTDQETGQYFEGVFDFRVSLEYAPDALEIRALPGPGGCSRGLSMFAESAGSGGMDVPEIDGAPWWETDIASGELTRKSTGFYMDEVYGDDLHLCQSSEALLVNGVELTDAGDLNGALTPTPAIFEDVTLQGAAHAESGFQFNEEINVEWTAEGWDSVWIQMRRERDGVAQESVTCNATGGSSFVIGATVWDLLTEDLPGVNNNVYVAFQNADEFVTENGQTVEVATRAMHVATIID